MSRTHYDIEATLERWRKASEAFYAEALAMAPDDMSRRFVALQQRLATAAAAINLEAITAVNEGEDYAMIEQAAVLAASGVIGSYIANCRERGDTGGVSEILCLCNMVINSFITGRSVKKTLSRNVDAVTVAGGTA